MKISAFIRENIETILQEWEKFADTIQPKSGAMNKKALRDHAKYMLEAITDDLDLSQSGHQQAEKSKGRGLEADIASAAGKHGVERLHAGFGVNALISEYRALRASVIRLWSEMRPEEMDSFGLIRFNEAVDQQIYEAVDSYTAERDLQARQFDTILSSTSDHSYILDLDGKFRYANKPMLQVLNVTLDELVGKSHFDLNFSTAHEIHTSVKQVTQLAERRSGEVKYSFPSGEVRVYEYLYSPVLDDEEEVLAVAAIERDVTYRKQVTEGLQKSEEDCRRRVEERTRELQEAHAQLLHAEKLSAIGQFSASIAHEFNNPLQSVMTTLKSLRKSTPEDDKELMEAAIVESERMKNLIRNLQDYNRPSSGKKVFMDVHASIDSLLLLCRSDFKRKRISTVLNYDQSLPQILAIPDQIKQVILNLLNNAAYACQKSDGTIKISTCYDEERIAVSIQDNGVGIKPEKIDLIFEPFYTSKPGVEGTGLGLSVCRGIVQTHNGEIRVESQPGVGSTFTVMLPIAGE